MSSLSQIPASFIPFKSILDDAMTKYQKKTKKNLLEYWLATELKSCESIDDVMDILRDQAKAVERTSAADQRLMKRIGSSVNVLASISDTLGGGIGLAFPPAKVIFSGISFLLSVSKGVKASHDALADLFGRIEDFFKRFKVYIESSLTTELLGVLVDVVVEILSILSIATKEMEQSLTKKFLKKLVGRADIEDGLKKLDNLIQGEHGMATAQVLKATTEIKDDVKELLLEIERLIKRAGQEEWKKTRQAARKWASPPDGPDPFTNHDIACKAYHEGTATWFFEGSMFEDWMSVGSLLWVHGKPGSGKIILCSAIIQHIRALCGPRTAHLSYFYFDFRDEQKQNVRNLITSLLSQFSALSDPCCNVISHLYSTHGDGTQKPTDGDLAKCLKQMLSVLAENPVYVVMDALDECPDDSGWPKTPREEVLDVVRDLVELGLPNLRICVTSRPEVDIKSVLNQLTIHAVSLHDQSEQKKGIADYVSTIVNSDRKMREWPDEDKELVIKELSERADGMFRWVVCQLETLRRSLQRNLRGILSKLPKTLDETYERVLRDIHEDNKEHARRLLHCLAVAVRPLRVEELAEILAFDFDVTEGDIPEYHADWRWKDQEEAAVLSTCSSLITIAEHYGYHDDGFHRSMWRVVQFSHFSVKEFLMSNRLATPTRDVSRYHILSEPAHTILAQACLGFLLHLDGCIDPRRVEDSPLAKYAAKHWIAHAQFQDVASHVKFGMKDLFDPDKPHFSSWVGIHNIDEPTWVFDKIPLPTPLYYSALCGFHDLAEHLAIKYPQHVNAICGQCDFPLVAALSGSHVSVAEVLLEHGGKVNVRGTRGRTPLHTLLDICEDEGLGNRIIMVRLLLERGADVNAQDTDHETPLHLAMRHETSDLARILLEHGADPNLENKSGKTSLHTLLGPFSPCDTKYYRVDYVLIVARLLLEHGANVNTRDEAYETPLLLAMRHETSDLAQILLDHGADPNLQNKDGKTPLHRLLGSYSPFILVVAQLLLERGADVNARDTAHETPLRLAIRYESSDLLRILLDHDADPNLGNQYDETPLHMLLGPKENDHFFGPKYYPVDYILSMAQLLLECGANVNARDEGHATPLLLAMQHDSETSDIAHVLLEHGADPNLGNERGKTPLHMLLEPKAHDHRDFSGSNYHRVDHILVVAQVLLERGADVNARDKAHETPLLLAIRHETSDLARILLDHGADPNLGNQYDETPLHMLLGTKANDHFFGPKYYPVNYILIMAQLLLERGANVNAQDEGHETPLLLAMRHETSDLARVLLEYGADPNLGNEHGKTPLHMLLGPKAIDHLSGSNYHRVDHILVVAQLLLERGADVNARDECQETPLLLAMRHETSDLPCFLLEQGADPDSEDQYGKSPLHTLLGPMTPFSKYRCADYILPVAQSLLERGADVNARDKSHRTPLFLAMRHETSDIARFLLEYGANPNMVNGEGYTPLHTLLLGRERKNVDDSDVLILHLLLEHGADTGAQNKNQATPLDLAPYYGKVLIAQILLDHANKSEDRDLGVNAQDKDNAARLRLACYCGRLEIVQDLLNLGTKANLENFRGEKSLHLLSQGEYDSQGVPIAHELLKHGVDVNAQCKRQRTPLHLASYFGKPAIAQVLLNYGAKPNTKDSNGEIPLHLLSRGRYNSQDDGVNVARLLIERGTDINAQDMEHRTPLHHASSNGMLAIAQLLLEHGVRPNAKDKDGETPLHLALQCEDESEERGIGITRLLLEHGADIDAQDNNHLTPLYLSSLLQKPRIANLLLEHSATCFISASCER